MPTLAIVFSFLERTRGPHWAAKQNELAQLSAAVAGVLVYIPLPERELGIAVAVQQLGLALVMTIGPRVMMDQSIQAQRREAAAAVAAAEDMTGGAYGPPLGN